MNYSFNPEARRELLAQGYHFEEMGRKHVKDFEHQFNETLQSILAHPQARTKIDSVHRRAIILKYQIAVVYRYYSDQDLIRIIAVADTRRNPGYWKDRI